MNPRELINLHEAYLEIYENIGTGKSKRASFGGISQRPSEREIRDIRAAARKTPEPIPEEKPRQKRKGIGILPSGGVGSTSKVLRGGYGRTPEGIARRRATELKKRSRSLVLPTSEVISASNRADKITAALKKSKKWGTPEAAEEVILGYLIDEGFVDSLESAEVILENMSDEWLESIFEKYEPFPYEKVVNKLKGKEKRPVKPLIKHVVAVRN